MAAAKTFLVMQRAAGVLEAVEIGTVKAASDQAALKKWLKEQPDEMQEQAAYKPEAGYIEVAGTVVTAIPE